MQMMKLLSGQTIQDIKIIPLKNKALRGRVSGLLQKAGGDNLTILTKNTLTMKPSASPMHKAFCFYDGEKYIGSAKLSFITEAIKNAYPKDWYKPGQGEEFILKTKPICYVNELMVHDKLGMSEYTKRKSGKKYGTMCMQKILEWAKENGCDTRIALQPAKHGSDVSPSMFYAKIGFDLPPAAKKTREELEEILNSSPRRRMSLQKVSGRHLALSGDVVVLSEPDVLRNYLIK